MFTHKTTSLLVRSALAAGVLVLAGCATHAKPADTVMHPFTLPPTAAEAVTMAQAARAQDNYEDAVAIMQAAEAKFGVSAQLRIETSWNLLMMMEEDITRGVDEARLAAQVADSRQRWREAVEMDPAVEGRELLDAKILRYEHKEGQAWRVLEEHLAAHPDDAFSHQELGDLARKQQNWPVVEREYSEVARLIPNDGWAVLYATHARQWLKHPAAEVEKGYLEAARLLPEAEAPLRLLNSVHPKEPEKTIPLLETVVLEQPKAVCARIWIAYLVRTRPTPDLARAESVLREAIAANADSPATLGPAHLNLGETLEAAGRRADAAAEYAAAVEAGTAGDVGDASASLSRMLRADGSAAEVAADVRRRWWDAVVAKNPQDSSFARDAAQWYADIAHDAAAARHFSGAAQPPANSGSNY